MSPKADLPVVEGGGASARIVMGSLWGATSPVTCHSHTIYADIHLSPGGAMPIDPGGGGARPLCRRGRGQPRRRCRSSRATLYVLRPGIAATLRSERGGHVMLCGGAPLDGPRHVFWNFVSSRRERINQAKEDWKAGRFALPPDDHDEFIPLPEVAEDGELSMSELTTEP